MMKLYATKVDFYTRPGVITRSKITIDWNRIGKMETDFLEETGPIMRVEYFDTVSAYDRVIYIKANGMEVK